MNFVVICLHCLDMRDFHSELRTTPFLDALRQRSIFVPMGRGQGHHHGDSLNAELTGIWTARYCDSELTEAGYRPPQRCWFPRTVIERLQEAGYDIFTAIDLNSKHNLGSYAVEGGMRKVWLREEPHRLRQFSQPRKMTTREITTEIKKSRKFYAHIFLRHTHRPWGHPRALFRLVGHKPWRLSHWLAGTFLPSRLGWPAAASMARRAALEKPDEFAALRRQALARADMAVAEIFEDTEDLNDVTYIVYSNHGEMYDHFRYTLPYIHTNVAGSMMIEGTSHGNYPYEVLYANMQMWLIPNSSPKVMQGIGRSIDLAPTILNLAGIESSSPDGRSMLGNFREGTFPKRDRYAENPLGGGCISMVREDGYKLVSVGQLKPAEENRLALRGFPQHRLAVFDLTADPDEYVNLIDSPTGQEVLRWAIRRHRELKCEVGNDVAKPWRRDGAPCGS